MTAMLKTNGDISDQEREREHTRLKALEESACQALMSHIGCYELAERQPDEKREE
jgi:hypothetical protein